MKRDVSAIIVGVLFLCAGVAIGGSMLGYFDFRIDFSGWWTLFLIIPALLSIVQGGFNAGNIIILGVGLVFLLDAQHVLPRNFSWKLMFPVVLMGIGVQLLFGTGSKTYSGGKPKKNDSGNDGAGSGTRTDAGGIFTSSSKQGEAKKSASVLFGGQEIFYGDEDFTGATYSAVFGALSINMRNVRITGDVVINVTAMFGGVEIVLPDNVQIVSNVTPVLGGVEIKYAPSRDTLAPRVILNGNVSFGGLEIK